jgi:hypothetical protein
MIESFWVGRTKLLNRRRWRTRIDLANAIFEYLEIFHNRQRRPRHAHARRVRTPRQPARHDRPRSLTAPESSIPTPRMPGHIKDEPKPGPSFHFLLEAQANISA